MYSKFIYINAINKIKLKYKMLICISKHNLTSSILCKHILNIPIYVYVLKMPYS